MKVINTQKSKVCDRCGTEGVELYSLFVDTFTVLAEHIKEEIWICKYCEKIQSTQDQATLTTMARMFHILERSLMKED